MDGAVHAAAAEQGGVGGIDDGVNVERGDVGLEDLDPARHCGFPSSPTRLGATPLLEPDLARD